MSDGVFNIAKGRVNELVARVISGDPAGSVLIVVLATGSATDSVIRDYDTLAALLADSNLGEATFTNYARKTITDPTRSVDDVNNRQESDFDDQTWSDAGGTDDNELSRMFVCYAASAAAVDTAIVPLTYHDFVYSTDGTDIVAKLDSAGFFRAM